MKESLENRLAGVNKPLLEQVEILKMLLLQNQKLWEILTILSHSKLKDYYVSAGAINQTVFNYYHGYELDYGIKDVDIVYYDSDVSYEKEDKVIKYVNSLLQNLDIEYDIKNEARVHLWYEEKYGKTITPYTNVEDAISSWGSSITCIGVRLEDNNLVVYAPYGLNDIFNMTIRPIKKQFSKERYQEKTKKWKEKWPLLTVIPWNDETK